MKKKGSSENTKSIAKKKIRVYLRNEETLVNAK